MRDAGVAAGDLVVDVGAGSGMLTRALLAAGASVWAIEPDVQLAARLRRACPAATVVQAEARTGAWPREPFRVVANLPFAHGTEILRALLSDPRLPLRSADVIVEWDAAVKRTRLWPGSMLAALWGAWYELAVVRRIAPTAFAPPPSVAAAVLRATRRPSPLVDPRAAGAYEEFLRRAFRSGRLPEGARRLGSDFGFDAGSSPRDLDAVAWAAIWHDVSVASRRTSVTEPRRRRSRHRRG